jgi:biofilm protein TabA
MILDRIEQLGAYNGLSRHIETVMNFLETANINDLVPGRFDFSSDVFGILLSYATKMEADCLWEAHRKYVDMHFVLEGTEWVHTAQLTNMSCSKEYDTKDDYALFTGKNEKAICLEANDFLMLFPHEVHKTAVLVEKQVTVKKIVFKIPVFSS